MVRHGWGLDCVGWDGAGVRRDGVYSRQLLVAVRNGTLDHTLMLVTEPNMMSFVTEPTVAIPDVTQGSCL